MKKKMRFLNLLAVLIVLFAGVYPANATLKGFSLNATFDGTPSTFAAGAMPTWFQGQDGVSVGPCITDIAKCGLVASLPAAGTFSGTLPMVFPSNYSEENFYFHTLTNPGSIPGTGISATIEAALEYMTINATTGNPTFPVNGVAIGVFQRLRIQVEPLAVPGATGIWTVDHPWGTTAFNAADCKKQGTGCQITIDVPAALAKNSFTASLGLATPVPADSFTMDTFLKSTSAPAGFLGDAATATTFTGGTIRNFFKVTGPPGTGTTPDITLATITGRTIGLDVAPATNLNFGAATITAAPIATTPQTQTVTVTNTTADPILFGAVAAVGANAADFTIVAPDTCSNTPVAAGANCSFNVTFAPTATTPVLALRAATILIDPTTVQPPVTVPPTPVIPNPPAVTLSLSGTAQFPLAVTVTGTGLVGNLGNGSVSSAPAGIGSCTTAGGANCTAPFNAGSTVTLTPTAAASPLSLFDGWGPNGACTNVSGNCSVIMDAAKTATASFIRAFTITTSAAANGTITAGSIVKQGTSPTLFITPNTGFRFLSLLDNNVSVTAAVAPPTPPAVSSSFTINDNNLGISTDHTVAAVFAVNNYVLTLTPTTNGTITGPADANHFQTATFIITPVLGHHIDTLTDSGDATANPQSVKPGTLGTSTYTTSTITGPRTITVTFAIGQENITTSVSKGNGTIVANPAAVNFGSNSTITITPALGYHIETLTDNGTDVKASVTPAAAGTFTYTINGIVVEHNVVVGLSNVLNMTSSAGANGTLASPSTAIFGTTPSVTATPKSRLFQVRDILKNNSALSFTKAANPGDAVTIALPPVTADSTVNATFMPSGDLNADGSLTVADAMKALRIVIGLQLASGDDAVAMDVAPLGNDNKPLGGNGTDMADVLVILKRVVNAITW